MSFYSITLKANVPTRVDVGGKLILIDSLGSADSVDIQPIQHGRELRNVPSRKLAFKWVIDFTGVIFKATVDTTIYVFLSYTEVDLGFTDGSSVAVLGDVAITNGPLNPASVNIENDIAGNVAVTNGALNPVSVHVENALALSGSITVGNNNAAAVPVQQQALSTIGAVTPHTVGLAVGSLISDATLKRLRFRNTSATATIALGDSAVTMNSPLILGPGDIYFEDDAAGAHWYAISDEAGASLQTLGIK
ncbi:MAG: hypothetical protein V4563_15075 [Pseudomonadota bacterium]